MSPRPSSPIAPSVPPAPAAPAAGRATPSGRPPYGSDASRTASAADGTFWRFRSGNEPAFDPAVFDERALAARGALSGHASAGRGDTAFFALGGHELVLRHYRRGGLVRRLDERHYLWTGLERTRAVREFECLRELEARGLPAPRPFACAVTRRGLRWSGSLVTHRLPGRTLAEGLDGAPLATSAWVSVGRCIARFHAAGCRHADLNAHNVMLDGGEARLIDFDRASWRRAGERGTRWQRANLARLRRSLEKLARRHGRAFDAAGFDALEEAWSSALGASPRP